MQSRPRSAPSRVLPLLVAAVSAMGLSAFPLSARALEAVTGPYTGDRAFNVGDAVEATYAGTWTRAEVVGVDREGGRYRIHFEGEKSCNNHALDSWIAKQWVRPVKGNAPVPPKPDRNDEPAPGRGERGGAAGAFRVGETVLYTQGGVIWRGGARIEAYDPAKRAYRIRFDNGSGDILPPYALARPGQFDNRFYIGKWDVRVNGATTTSMKDGENIRRFSGGTKLWPLQINADGTYVWQVEKQKTIRGHWKPREGAPGIVVLRGLDGKDWTLFEKTEGYAPTADTRDEIGFYHFPSQTGYYIAYRIGPNRSSVLAGRQFGR